MTRFKLLRIICDGCGYTLEFQLPNPNVGNGKLPDGWVREEKTARELCATCNEAILTMKEMGFTDKVSKEDE